MSSPIIDTPHDVKTRLLNAVIMFNDGISSHRVRVIGVGNTDPDTDRVYMHLASIEKFRQQRNGKVPVQFCGWYDIENLDFVPAS